MNRFLPIFCAAFLVLELAGTSRAANAPGAKEAAPPPPALPPIESLSLEPASLTFESGWEAGRVLVWGRTAAGEQIDLTVQAAWQSDSPSIEIKEGHVYPKNQGEGEATISVAGRKIKLPVTVKNADQAGVRFVRDVMPIISKVGCNAGTCHGSAKGKNGFKLSLRGYDPEFDYHALIDDLSGRRFNRVAVDESLMLLKPTAEVPHEGRQVIKTSSREYQVLRQWIAEGTKYEEPAAGRANKLEVLPKEINISLPGMTQAILVLAHYPDGTVRDVTRDAVLSSSNGDVADVKNGVVTSLRRGEGAVLIRYEGLYGTTEIRVMGDRAGYVWTDVPEYNYVDQHVNAKLKKMKILPSDMCTDAEFIRRVTLDLTGQPPQTKRIRAFLADPAPSKQKREQLIDELLGSKGYVEFWANKWSDLLQSSSEKLGQKGLWVFREWIRNSLEQGKPYDQLVRELLLAEGSSYQNPAVNYLRVLREPDKITEDVSQTFLGTRFNCNKCHDHPFEKWTQNQYYQFGAFFAQVAIKRGTMGKETIRNATGDQMTVTGEEIVYKNYNGGEVKHPKTGNDVAPLVPFGKSKETADEGDRREGFVEWLTSKENPLFATAMANRMWSYFYGRGIIDPVDDIRGSNPASNQPLLDALTKDFVQSGFDLKHLMQTICKSRTYQLSIIKNKWNEDDSINFSHAQPRRLSAEQLIDAVAVATGHRPKYVGLPVGMRAVEVPDGSVAGNEFLSLFGRPKRQSACECERTSNLTLSHAMSLINGSTIGDAIEAPDNRIKQIVDEEKDNKKVVEEIYLACLSRLPTEKEIAVIDFSGGASRLEVAQDMAWALMNSPAFLFNR
jgi:hypothetical protein